MEKSVTQGNCDGISCLTKAPIGVCFSHDRRFRYVLWRRWGDKGRVIWILMNPSIANESVLDATLKRCMSNTRRFGCESMIIANLFPIVSTARSGMIAATDRDGEENGEKNYRHIRSIAKTADLLIVGFGTDAGTIPKLAYSVPALQAAIGDLPVMTLRITKNGLPSHPLYLPGDLDPIPYIWPTPRSKNVDSMK